jgi:hypothetical protein
MLAAKYEFTPEMREISGFGEEYEATCRAMLKAALEWLDAHPKAEPKFHGYKNVYGIIEEENDDARELSKAAIKPHCTGAMHQAVISHALVIRKHGWDWYVRKMSEPDKEVP